MIIEVVGVDGSGKTTLIHGLRKDINEGGKAWAYERSFQSENVRMLEAAASVKGARARPRVAFSGDVIETARTLELVGKSFQLAFYKCSITQHVFCDSYLVEQGARLCNSGLTESANWTLLDMATAPDLCVYLKIDAGDALQRMRSRLKGDSLLLEADPLSATAAIIAGLERALSRMPYPHIIVDAGQSPHAVPSAKALLPQVVAKPHLERANGYLSVAYTSGHLLGPMLAGVLVAAQLGVVAIALDALSFLLSAVLVASLRLPTPTRHVTTVTVVAQFVEGVQLLCARRGLMWMLFAGVTLHLTTLPAVYALGPAWAQTHLGGAAAWAMLVSAFGIGGVIGGLVAAHVRPHRPALWFFLSLIPVAAQPLMLVWAPAFWWVAALQGLAGFSLALLNVMEDLSLQHGVPPTLIARVASLLMFASTVALPVGYAAVAGMASTLGVQMAMTVLGVACVLIAMVGVTLPGVRTFTVARSRDAVCRH